MDNKTQLQANNARIEALTEILKNKSAVGGSGGLEINGLIQQAIVNGGTTVVKGDFVTTINEMYSTSLSGWSWLSTSSGVRVIKLSENVYFAVTNDYYKRLGGAIIQCNENELKVTATWLNQNANYLNFGRAIPIRINENTVFIAHSGINNSYYLYGSVVTIDGTTMKLQKTTKLSETTYSFYAIGDGGDVIQGVGLLYDTDKVLVCVPYTSSYPVGMFRFQIGEDYTITQIGEHLTTSDTIQLIRNCQLINNTTALVTAVHGNTANKGTLYKVDLENWTYSTIMSNLPTLQSYNKHARSYVINETTVLYVANDTSSTFKVYLIDIENNSVIMQKQVSTTFKIGYDIQKVDTDKYAIAGYTSSTNGQLMILQVSNTDVNVISTQTFQTEKSLFAMTGDLIYDETSGDYIALYSYVARLYLTPRAKTITSATELIKGVAKDDGNSGDLIEVFMPNV